MSSDHDAVPRLAYDTTRSRWGAVVVLLAFGATYAALSLGGDRLGLAGPSSDADDRSYQNLFGSYFVSWVVYCAFLSALTVRALSPADGHELRTWMLRSRAPVRFSWLRAAASDTGTAGAVAFCLTAVVAVIIAATEPSLRDEPGFVVLAFLAVASSWMLIVVTLAAHYARKNAHEPGLSFSFTARDELPRFFDYLYFSIQIATAFSSSDAAVTTRSMRRTVAAHVLVAFVFNTVIVALLVSFLLAVMT